MNKRSIQILLFVAVLVVATWATRDFFFKPGSAEERAGAGAGGGQALPVVVGKVEQRNYPVQIDVIGRVEAKASVTLRSRVDGQVLSNDFKEGQAVKQGQILIRIDPAAYANQLRQAEATLAKDQAQLQKLQADLKRNQDLAKQGFISEVQLTQVQTDLLTTQANIRADQANVDNARLTLSYTSIRAPMDGVAGAIQVYPGGVVRSNDTALLVINQVQPTYISFAIPEGRLAQLKASLVKGPVAVIAHLPSQETEIKGQVVFVNNAVDVSNGTMLVKAQFDNKENLLTPGQFASVSLVIDQIQNALIVPSPAVQTNPKGNFVYVVKPDQTVEARVITVQLAVGNDAVVGGDLHAGETVVTDGHLRVKPGSKVKTSTEPVGVTPTDIPKLTS